jgi:zinc protease
MWSDGAPRLFCLANLPLSDPAGALTAAFKTGLDGEVLPLPTPAPSQLHYAPAALPAKIRRRQHVRDLDLHLVEFANGVRLNLKRTDFSRNSVILRARVGRGRLGQPAHSPGLALLAGSYLNDAGVGRHDGQELQRFVDEHNLALSFGTEEDAFVFMGGADTSATNDLLQLLSAYLSDPAWRDEEFGAAQRRVISHFHDAMHEPFSSLQTHAARVISRNDPRFILPPPSVTNARTLAELMAWIETELKTGGVEIGLVGDFDLESTVDFAARTLGALPRRESRKTRTAAAPAIPFERKPGRWITSVESTIPRAAVRAQWPVRGCGDIHQRRHLETLAAVMQNRVRREIREQLGATYDPSADIFSGDTLRSDGYLLIQISTNPADASRLADRIVQIAANIAQHGVSEEELQAVVQPRLAENAARLRDNSYWLFNVVSAAQTQRTRLEWPRTRERDYARLNRAQISRLASEFLAAERAQIFVVGPAETMPVKSLAVHSVQ